MNKSWHLIYIIIIVLLILYAIFGDSIISHNGNFRIVYQKDTIIEYFPKVIKADSIKAKIIIKRDTIIQTKPFAAVLDTVWMRDTVFLRYDYPENNFSFRISRPADSIIVPKLYEYEFENCKLKWYESTIIFIAGIAGGYLFFK